MAIEKKYVPPAKLIRRKNVAAIRKAGRATGLFSAIISSVEAGTGVAIVVDVFGHSFGNRVKLLHITPEPKPISVGIAGTEGRLSPAAEKFWQCAKEAASRK